MMSVKEVNYTKRKDYCDCWKILKWYVKTHLNVHSFTGPTETTWGTPYPPWTGIYVL